MTANTRSRSWCFTLNNFTSAEYDAIIALDCKYLVVGKEVGEEGTPHLQGYIAFLNPVTLAQAKGRLSARAHLERPHGNAAQNRTYCTKEGDFFEKGECPSQGKRNDIQELVDAINGGERSLKRLRQTLPAQMAKYPSFARNLLIDTQPKPEAPDIQLFQWQKDLFELLQGEPLERKIHWYADFDGNAGKSTFATYCEAHLEDIQVMKPGKLADLAYDLIESTRILIMDCPRSREQMFPYSFLEDVKDRRVFSSKYESFTKRIPRCHVVVFANFKPEVGKLSPDRPLVIELSETPDAAVANVIEIM